MSKYFIISYIINNKYPALYLNLVQKYCTNIILINIFRCIISFLSVGGFFNFFWFIFFILVIQSCQNLIRLNLQIFKDSSPSFKFFFCLNPRLGAYYQVVSP